MRRENMMSRAWLADSGDGARPGRGQARAGRARRPDRALVAPAAVAADPANRWTLELRPARRVVIQLRPDIAPHHVYRIQQLTTQGFYNGLTFHRVIPGFMAQGGDPKGTGQGGSPLPDLAAEFNDLPHLRGVLSMARAEAPNSANSQFFIVLAPTFKLDHKYTALAAWSRHGGGRRDRRGEPPAEPTRIVRARIGGPLPRAAAPRLRRRSRAAPPELHPSAMKSTSSTSTCRPTASRFVRAAARLGADAGGRGRG